MADGTKIFRPKPYREFIVNVAVYEVIENPEYFDPLRTPTPVPPSKYLHVKVAESECGRAFSTLELVQVHAQDRKNEREFATLTRSLGFLRWIEENLKAVAHRVIVDRENGIAPMIKAHLEKTP